ncbi:MAG: gamma-glutamyl-gamma-aminobutyrate hydrolase family protein [Trueperaceae bacterium]
MITTGTEARERPLRRTDVSSGRNYADALAQVGLLPSYLPSLDPELAGAFLDDADGVVLSGGGDVDPARCGQVPHPDLGEVDHQRDAFELALYRSARERGLPVLGICRGVQLVVVAEGGDLHQHLPALPGMHQHEQAGRDGDPLHGVHLAAGSVLRAHADAERIAVNSFHHQGVDRLPDALAQVGRSDDGLVEAVEAASGAFLLAMQWHPEMAFRRHASARAPFAAIAAAQGA